MLMTARHAKRLLVLARKLDTVPVSQFDMKTWWDERCNWNGEPCGSAGCALGWAGTIPAFRRAGLVTNKEHNAVTFEPVYEADKKTCKAMSFDAGERFFGLTEDEAVFLFIGRDGNRKPKQVAGNIRKLVKKYHPQLVAADAARRKQKVS